MKLFQKAGLAFKRLKAALKPGFGTKVITALTGNADTFPDLPVKLSDLQAANDAVVEAIPLALTGNHESIEQLKGVAAHWNGVFGETAGYVSTVADGDAATILKAGYNPTKGESSSKQKPGSITAFAAQTNGFKNAVVAGTKKAVAGASAFGYIAVPDGAAITTDGNMTIVTIDKTSIYFSVCTQRQTELYNLPEGAPYTITMFAVNSAGTGPSVTSQTVRPQ